MSAASSASVDLKEFVQLRARLVARREELVRELQEIDAALRAPRVQRGGPRKRDGLTARIRDYVREHPGLTAREICAALGVNASEHHGLMINMHTRGMGIRVDRTVSPHRWYPA